MKDAPCSSIVVRDLSNMTALDEELLAIVVNSSVEMLLRN